jgi:hypothetical protein
MTTFLSRPSFERFQELCRDLLAERLAPAAPGRAGVAGLFLPWAGQHLSGRRGIYWIGAGTKGDYGVAEAQTYEACHERAASLCDRGPHGDRCCIAGRRRVRASRGEA